MIYDKNSYDSIPNLVAGHIIDSGNVRICFLQFNLDCKGDAKKEKQVIFHISINSGTSHEWMFLCMVSIFSNSN